MFLSYARSDTDYVVQLAEHLNKAGVSARFDRDIPGGQRWERMLRDRIDTCAAFIVVMTPAAADPGVLRELDHAQRRQRPIFPLLLAGTVFPVVRAV